MVVVVQPVSGHVRWVAGEVFQEQSSGWTVVAFQCMQVPVRNWFPSLAQSPSH